MTALPESSSQEVEAGGLADNVAAIGPRLKPESFEVPAMSLSRKHWDRLQEQIEEAKMGWTELWLGTAFTFLGIAASAALAFVTLPASDPQLPSSLHSNLLVGTIGATVIFGVCIAAWLCFRRDHNAKLDSISKNMESHEHDAK